MAKDSKPRGRQTTFNQAIADRVCEGLAAGQSLRDVCTPGGMPSESTVRGWAIDDRNGFAAQYTRARELQAEYWADEINDIGDDGRNDWIERFDRKGESIGWQVNGEAVARSKLRADNRKWLLSKLLPKKYGEKITQELTGKDGTPLVPAIAITVGSEPPPAPQAGLGASDDGD